MDRFQYKLELKALHTGHNYLGSMGPVERCEGAVSGTRMILDEDMKKWWDRVKNIFIKPLMAMGVWVDAKAFPMEAAFLVIMGSYVYSNNETVAAAEFFRAFREGKTVPIQRNRRPVRVDMDDTTNTATETPATGIMPSPIAGPSGLTDTTTKTATTEPKPSIIEVNINDVLDKSKSSALATLIICRQVGWMVLQLLGRRVSRLPITLIELHTPIHILVEVIRLWIWWYKPRDVFERVVLDTTFTGQRNASWSTRPECFQT